MGEWYKTARAPAGQNALLCKLEATLDISKTQNQPLRCADVQDSVRKGYKENFKVIGDEGLRLFCSQCWKFTHQEFNPQDSRLWFLMSYYWKHQFVSICHFFTQLHLTEIWKEKLQGRSDKHLTVSKSKPDQKNKWKTMTLLGKTKTQISL